MESEIPKKELYRGKGGRFITKNRSEAKQKCIDALKRHKQSIRDQTNQSNPDYGGSEFLNLEGRRIIDKKLLFAEKFYRNTRSKSKTSEVKRLRSQSSNTINKNVTKHKDSELSKEEDVKNCLLQDKNVFYMDNIETLCVACQKSLDHQSCSVFEKISITDQSDNSITIFEALQLLSNFAHLEIDLINVQICSTCLSSTKKAIYFQNQCNNSVELIKSYLNHQVEVKIEIVENEIEGLQDEEKPEIKDSHDEEMSEETKWQDSEMSEGNESEIDEYMSEDKECEEENSRNHRTKSPREICLCSWCGKQYPNVSRLNQHIKLVHTEPKRRFQCPICGKARNNLNQHLKTHTNERPVACPKCPKTFRDKWKLNIHMVVHADVKPFKCTACGKGFTQRYYFRTHQAKSCPGVQNKGISTGPYWCSDDDES